MEIEKNEIVYKMKQRNISFSEKAYDEIFEYIKKQMESFKSSQLDIRLLLKPQQKWTKNCL